MSTQSWLRAHGRTLGIVIAAILAVIVLVRLAAGPRIAGSVDAITERGELVVLTLRGPTTYDDSADGPRGYEVDLSRAFAESIGAEPRFVVLRDIDTLLKRLQSGHGHIAAANLTVTEDRTQTLVFGPAYKSVREEVVCHREKDLPGNVGELADRNVAALSGSSYVATLTALKAEHPSLEWQVRKAGSAMPLLERVSKTEGLCTLADSHLVAYARRQHPELAIPLILEDERPLAWAVNTRTDGLQDALETWFASAHEDGTLARLDERWFGHFDEFDYVDVARFQRRVETRLPAYRALFERAAKDSPFDWRLLAAQAYQESHWNPDAESATGVRGLMMLTLPTAREVGIEDRLDPEQSIRGGATYLKRLYDRLPESITGRDRVWFALAAYNVGYGHLMDARTLAQRDGRNPDLWTDVEAMLPLLTRPAYYRTVRFGYARGYEPVRYVQKVREYRTMLEGAD